MILNAIWGLGVVMWFVGLFILDQPELEWGGIVVQWLAIGGMVL